MKIIGNHNNNCPICRRESKSLEKTVFDTRFGVDGQYRLYHCHHCDLIIISNSYTFDNQKKLYEKYYNYGNINDNRSYRLTKSMFFKSIFYKIWMMIDGDICFHAKKGNGKLLDVGCNEGTGLTLYQKNAFAVEGLEMNSLAAQAAQKMGFSVHTGNIETFSKENHFDVVVFSNILEHSNAPFIAIRQAYRLLKPTGEVWISTPNANSIFRNLFGKYWINWHAPFHINIFSHNALVNILNQAGFKITEAKIYSPSLWIAQSVISTLYSKIGQKTRQHRNIMLLGALMTAIRLLCFPFLFLVNRFEKGDCITITAKKA